MNKKELLKGGLDDIYRKYYFDLKERIEKAIEYIEDSKLNRNKVSEMLMGDEIVKLLDILRGEDNVKDYR